MTFSLISFGAQNTADTVEKRQSEYSVSQVNMCVCVQCARAYVRVWVSVCLCSNGQFEVGLTSMSTDPAECNEFTILSACSSHDYIGILTPYLYWRKKPSWIEGDRTWEGGRRGDTKYFFLRWRPSLTVGCLASPINSLWSAVILLLCWTTFAFKTVVHHNGCLTAERRSNLTTVIKFCCCGTTSTIYKMLFQNENRTLPVEKAFHP